jgi:hypothetical protein
VINDASTVNPPTSTGFQRNAFPVPA